MTIRTLFASALASAALLLAASGQPASAITLNVGESAVYNFDFTGNTPAPPYQTVNINFVVSGGPPTGMATFDLFDGLNATGTLLSHIPPVTVALGAIHLVNANSAGFIDGIFSVRINSFNATFDVVSASADAFTVTGALTSVDGTLATTPLPAALPLFAGGIGAMSVFAWKRKRKSS